MKMLLKSRRVMIICFILCSMIAFISCGKAEDKTQEKETITNVPADDSSNSEITNAPQDTDDNTATEPVVTNPVETKAYAETYKEAGELPSLAEVYKDKFRVGVALSKMDIENTKKAQLVASQFSSITCENEMKADFTLDRAATLAAGDEECPVVNMKNADTALTFAKENGLQMRGHTLVWHSQTPRWLFTVGYDDAPDAPFVTREVMLARMENYIRQEIEYVNSNYPGVIYAWDVVNEAIEPADGQENCIRTTNNYWYDVVGEDYIEMAFTYARKYADPDQKLFYNDYGTYEKSKLFPICNMISKLKEKNLIDGIGMQDHISIDYPAILDYQYAINKYAELGIEIQVTELDINTTDNSEEAQQKLASRYKLIMMILMNCIEKKNANITSVTFWGLTDDRSWLNNSGSANYPLLFDKDLNPKPAFFGVLQDDSINIY
ncbi:MAG TPA: endo-1,4-beta-xylanase [Mobilitalea sp.]|nr:endo-1,4-beta-xylanase [Mobilitalea sp.]